jgi:hypothetical protein
MNRNEYDKIIQEAKKISISKNADYSDAPLLLFKEKGVLVRMNDKICRLNNLLWNDKQTTVNDETIADTALDLINYSIYLIMMSRKKFS